MSFKTEHRGFVIGQLAGGLLLTAVLYIVLFWQLGDRVRYPWLRTVIFWLPVAFIPFLFLIPWGWGFGALLYVSVSLIVAALSSYGGIARSTARSTLSTWSSDDTRNGKWIE